MKLYGLTTLHREHPVIDETPYFSWKMGSQERNVCQKTYRILVNNGERTVWDSGTILSDRQNFIPYEGEELQSETTYRWTVTATDNQGNTAENASDFTTAFLNPKDLKAQWVSCPFERREGSKYLFGSCRQPVLFERHFSLEQVPEKAVIYATALGIYHLSVNGKRPDEREFAPEYTSYEKLQYYQVYDVTHLLQKGENTIALYVADGWYFSPQAATVMEHRREQPAILYQMHLFNADGTSKVIVSDGSETCRTDFIVWSDLYQGEKQDYTISAGDRKNVRVEDWGLDTLRVEPMDPVLPHLLLPAQRVWTDSRGETIVDFGQVITGNARVHIDVPRGQEVTLEYFEVLDTDGCYVNTVFAPQKDIVVSAGRPIEHQAWFTFHGFRYIRVCGMNSRKEDFTAVAYTTAKKNIGAFRCSDERMNRLYENIRMSGYNNMLSIPTDCPTREKAGWTGDILIFAKTALMNDDVTPFLTGWLRNLRADQKSDGAVMIVAPYMRVYQMMVQQQAKKFGDASETGVAGWSDAMVWVPYEMYRVTGNTAVLHENFEAMIAWTDYIVRTAREKRGYQDIPEEYDRYLWNTGFHFGEWLIPGRVNKSSDQFEICKESSYYTAPMYGYETVRRMAEICGALGKEDLKDHYRETAEKMKDAIINGIFRRNLMPEDLMGAYVMAFAFDLVPDDLRESFKDRFVDLIHQNGDCLGTGFLATPYLLDALVKIGRTDLALTVLWQNRKPSWLYEVDQGATTIWESWDADKAKQTGEHISFDHYAFGCVEDWILRRICGLDSDTPGYRHLVIDPVMDPHLSQVSCRFECEYGEIAISRDETTLSVTLPCGTSAAVRWNGEVHEVGSGSYRF